MLDNPRHEKFCQNVAAGMQQGRAYEEAGFNSSGAAADSSAYNLLRNTEIQDRVAAIRKEMAEKVSMTKQELAEYLVELLKTPAGEIDEGHKFCQSYKHTAQERSLKIPDKLRAGELLSKLCGWNEPEKITHEAGDTLTQFLKRARAGNG